MIITPIIHLNGDRRETLLANLEHAHDAVSQAMEALRQCSPNGRNFYIEPGRLQKAQAQHQERMDHLVAVYYSLAAEAEQMNEERP